ncbi:carbon-nitrogen hydrolase family protein [Ktedonospora formicarum]|uniref:Carbon-nitrogen hydrolase n=1 Tax=Ktedonospora formicarum TaxID=2778364 RepID=A0A8J3HVT7_9CHLR|nr:carbon-nitrogen hydrolase family protein [Ktedonospora formicarum]GHO41925.1 carbon-nitrogen hydrolase [Ktedonospora formicarum]
MRITVALLQMAACGDDQDANLTKGEEFCRRARAMGADIALFPEMWNIGYTSFAPDCNGIEDDLWKAPALWSQTSKPTTSPELEQARERWQAQAIKRDAQFIQHFQVLARELQMAIALTYLEQWPTAPRNSVSLIDRHGELLMTYAKVHTCDFSVMEAACTPGEDFTVCTLETEQGPLQIGTMICYDREFPESARILMLKGAEIILIPNACEMEANRLGQLRARAYENMVGVALSNYAAPDANGHSVAYDPIGFDEHGSHDTLVMEAGESEGIYLATFDVQKIRNYRERESWGNSFRKPHRYGLLTSSAVEPPFVRVNIHGERYDHLRR